MAKYEKWLKKENLLLIQAWARDGLTDEQIAHNMKINPDTLYQWKKKFSEISESLKENKEVADSAVENALYQMAISGNLGACCFYLKNRRPDKWRDKPDDKMSTEERAARVDLINAQTKKLSEEDDAGEDDGVNVFFNREEALYGKECQSSQRSNPEAG